MFYVPGFLCLVQMITVNLPTQILHNIASCRISLPSNIFIAITEGAFDKRFHLSLIQRPACSG